MWENVSRTAHVPVLVSVTIMVSGAPTDGHLFGDISGFGMALCMAIVMLIIRQHHETPMVPAACILCLLPVWQFAFPLDC